MSKGALHIGTSGWHYASWWGPFYPQGLRKAQALTYYAGRFSAAELNAPFYRTPTLEAVQGWFDQTPDDFRFTWKASKFITHWKQLSANSANSLELLETRLAILGHKIGPILFQLPPRLTVNRDKLAAFIAMLNSKRTYTFEFRHPSWYEPSIFELLHRHNIALCISDHAAAPAPRKATADFVYVRNHGPSGWYHGNYSEEALGDWARDICRWHKSGADIWVFFDNDVKSAAPQDAERLSALLST